MNILKNTLQRGLQATVPIILTIAIVVWLVSSIEAFFGFFIKLFIPNQYYYHGMGAVFGLLLVFGVGILMNAWAVNAFYEWWDAKIRQIPLVKTIYKAIQDVMGFLNSSKGETVIIELPQGRVLGFITRTEYGDLNLGDHVKDEVAVYIPLSYQVGGFTVLMPRSSLKPINLSSQDAMRFILTAGVGTGK